MTKHDRSSKLRVMAIGAHPDDVELFCAGTLARYVERGDEVTIAIVCRGDSASFDHSPDDLVKLRSQEARAAAETIGAGLVEIGLADWRVDLTTENKMRFANIIRAARPDVVLTHYHTDYGSDHNTTFLLVRDAALVATVPSLRTDQDPLATQPAIVLWEPLGGYGFQPDAYVDISGTIEKKLVALTQHRSQREWLSRHGGIDYEDYVRIMGRFRGYQCGVRFAEGFVFLKNWGQIRPGSVLP